VRARSAARGLPRGCSRWLCAFLVLVVFTTGASGHAALVRAVPWDGAVVREAPSALSLTFNEPISPLIIRLIGPDGKPIALRDVAVENATISIPAPPLQQGSYVLSWRVISADGHPVGGSVLFSVGAPSRSALPETQQSASSSVIAGLWSARFVIYIGLFVGIGGAVFGAWISHDRVFSTPAVQAAFLAVLAGGVLAASGAIGLQGMDALDLPLSAWREKVVWETGFKTSYGLTAVTAACALLLAGFSFFLSSQRNARVFSVAALLGAAIALSLSGHASTASPGLVSRPALLLHVACAIFWIGSLLPLWMMLWRVPVKCTQHGRQTRSAPSPTQPGLAPVAHHVAQVGQARLAMGEGWGGGSRVADDGASNSGPPPPTPTPPHKGEGSTPRVLHARASTPTERAVGAAHEVGSSLDRFSRVIPVPVAVVVASGSALALVQIDGINSLWGTSYGQVLLCKLALVAVLLALAWLNRYRLVPKLSEHGGAAVWRLRRSIGLELLLAVAILAVVALWRFTPPPRTLAVAAPISIHLHGEKAMAEIEIAREGGRGAGTRANVLVLDGAFQPLAAKEVTLVLASPASGIEPLRRRAARTGESTTFSSTWRIDDLTIPVAGQWSLRVEVLINDFEKVTLEETVRLPRMP
jgi:putative copper export protein/methionine-rich copper-binding protein CopC